MWAPDDLFTPLLNTFLFPLKRAVSYLYENPSMLALAVVGAALTIVTLTLIGGRHRASAAGDGSGPDGGT